MNRRCDIAGAAPRAGMRMAFALAAALLGPAARGPAQTSPVPDRLSLLMPNPDADLKRGASLVYIRDRLDAEMDRRMAEGFLYDRSGADRGRNFHFQILVRAVFENAGLMPTESMTRAVLENLVATSRPKYDWVDEQIIQSVLAELPRIRTVRAEWLQGVIPDLRKKADEARGPVVAEFFIPDLYGIQGPQGVIRARARYTDEYIPWLEHERDVLRNPGRQARTAEGFVDFIAREIKYCLDNPPEWEVRDRLAAKDDPSVRDPEFVARRLQQAVFLRLETFGCDQELLEQALRRLADRYGRTEIDPQQIDEVVKLVPALRDQKLEWLRGEVLRDMEAARKAEREPAPAPEPGVPASPASASVEAELPRKLRIGAVDPQGPAGVLVSLPEGVRAAGPESPAPRPTVLYVGPASVEEAIRMLGSSK